MAPEDSTSEDDADPDDEWKSSLRDLADRIRNEKSTARTAESTPASDWSPKITAAERPDADSATDGTPGFEFGHASSVDDAENERPEVTDSGDTDEAREASRGESTDPETGGIRNDEHTDTDLSVSESEESSAESSESAVEALGDVKTAASETSDGDGTTNTDTTTDTDDRGSDTDSADRSAVADHTDVDAEISAEETNFGDAFKTDSHADSSDLDELGTETDTPEDEEPSLGDIGAADETEATTAPSADTQSDSDSAVGATSEQAETETSTRNGVGSNTFGELADRMAASRENNASAERTDRNRTDSSEPDNGSSDDTPSQSDESSRQLPLGANEPEFSTDLAPLVQPNMSAMLLGALKSAPVDQACGKLLAFPDGRDYNLLLVTVTQSAEDRLLTVYENSEGLPENIGVVAIDNNVSAQNTTQTIPVGGVDRTVQMKTATDPGDIKGIGIRISKQLSEWDNNDRPTMVCFHSLTSILQYISTKQLFQFIHLLQNRLRSYDAVVHYHIDPSVHDKMTLSQIKPLLDHVIEVENDGTCWIE